MTRAVPVRILYVCTANECRSPFAAALTRQRAGSLPIDVDSAGIDTWRRGVPRTGLALARELGLDLESHVSRPVHPDFLVDYDIVLAMDRSHLRELASAAPEASGRLFTLMQFARWASEHPRDPGTSLSGWLAEAAAGQRTRVLSTDADDDVEDPIGQPIDQWRLMVQRLRPAIDTLVHAVFPRVP